MQLVDSEATLQTFLDGRVRLHKGDCLDVVRCLDDNSIDSVVTDPPYALTSIVARYSNAKSNLEQPEDKDLSKINAGAFRRLAKGFMGKEWDNGSVAFAVEFWAEILRVLKPGGHVAAFGGTRSYHRLACAIEDAGFEIRDQLAWAYGTGFPKSHDVSKGIDKAAGAEGDRGSGASGAGTTTVSSLGNGLNVNFQARPSYTPATDAARQWEGWGTALKPAWEPICLARKPLSERTVAQNVLRWGTGAINVGGCRVGTEYVPIMQTAGGQKFEIGCRDQGVSRTGEMRMGRWPANLCHDGSDEVLAAFPESKGQQRDVRGTETRSNKTVFGMPDPTAFAKRGDSGSAARFFYSAKASKADRALSKHPTVKPVKLKQWLCRMLTPPGGTVLDGFAGTGTTGEAAWREGFNAILIEREDEYCADIERRMLFAKAKPKAERKQEPETLPIPFDISLASDATICA